MYIQSVVYIFRVWCIYSECDVSESVLRGEHAMFCERIGKQCVSLRRNACVQVNVYRPSQTGGGGVGGGLSIILRAV